MYEFAYHRPASIAAATKAQTTARDGKFLAGGMTLIPTLKQRLARHSDLIDLAGIKELAGIREAAGAIVVGATTRHAEVAASALVQDRIKALAALAAGIGDRQVRNRGTLGGSLANNDPAADYPAACLGLGATVVTNRREIAADDYFKGLFETALDAGELIVAVRFPVPDKAAYMKFRNPASHYAIVGVFVARVGGQARVAVTGASQNGVFRAKAMEQALAKSWTADAVARIAIPEDGLNADIHASAEYRAHLVTVMAKRAVAAAG